MINLVALPCLCVDVFDGTDELYAGGEALNFAAHASKFEEFDIGCGWTGFLRKIYYGFYF